MSGESSKIDIQFESGDEARPFTLDGLLKVTPASGKSLFDRFDESWGEYGLGWRAVEINKKKLGAVAIVVTAIGAAYFARKHGEESERE